MRETTPGKKAKTKAQEALEISFVINGWLKRSRITYLMIGKKLAEVRDRKLYLALHHPDLESYADQHLRLGRSALFHYLQIYDWAAQFHPEWLQPNPKGFIPDLAGASDLIWLDNKLKDPKLDPNTRAALEALARKGLDGKLKPSDLDPYRHGRPPVNAALKTYLSKLRNLRMRGSQLASMPPEAVARLDEAIDIIDNALNLKRVAFQGWREKLSA